MTKLTKLLQWIKTNPATTTLRALVGTLVLVACVVLTILTSGWFLIGICMALVIGASSFGLCVLLEEANREARNRR